MLCNHAASLLLFFAKYNIMEPVSCAKCRGDVLPIHNPQLMRIWKITSSSCLHSIFGDIRINYIKQISCRPGGSPAGSPRELPNQMEISEKHNK